jgi:hypothetical protein
MRNFLAHYGLSIPMGHDVFEPALDSSKLSITQTVDTLEKSTVLDENFTHNFFRI